MKSKGGFSRNTSKGAPGRRPSRLSVPRTSDRPEHDPACAAIVALFARQALCERSVPNTRRRRAG